MTATVVTKEPFRDASDSELEREKELRIKAGAIRSWVEVVDNEKILFTEWNVIGQQ